MTNSKSFLKFLAQLKRCCLGEVLTDSQLKDCCNVKSFKHRRVVALVDQDNKAVNNNKNDSLRIHLRFRILLIENFRFDSKQVLALHFFLSNDP